MVVRTEDPVADFLRHDEEQNRWLEQLPVCEYCQDEIQDDYYFEINESAVCENCLIQHFRKEVGDFQ